jgi:electron transport complex protein RnfG
MNESGGGWKTIVLVGCIAAGAAALVSASWELSKDRIAANERARLLASLTSVLDARHLGDDVLPVLITAQDPLLLGTPEPVDVFIPFRDDVPLAAVFATVAPRGYNAPISLLVGIDVASSALTGVRVVSHRETPGLGDLIELRKSRWIRQFDGKSLAQPGASGWQVRQEGGAFDAITGATVTPKAVIEAVHNTLLYFDANHDDLIRRARESLSGDDGPTAP